MDLIKITWKKCVQFWQNFYKNFWRDKFFPDSFKIDKIKPLFKEGNDLNTSNYRPISLLPVFGKILERFIYNRMKQCLTKYQLIQNC